MSDFTTIATEQDGAVLTITLNRPEALNAVTPAMLSELRSALRQAAAAPEVRALVITGAGRGFCSGQDLKSLQDERGEAVDLGAFLRNDWNPLILQLQRLEKPVIAAVNGVAAGAGLSLALACDLRVASDQAGFIEVFARVGLVPDAGSSFLLPRLIGLGRAFEMCYTTDPISAETALQWGLVNRVVPAADLLAEARALAERLAQGPTKAYGLTKRALYHALDQDLEAALAYEASLQRIAQLTDDHREGVAAFLEKRAPSFRGR